MRKQNTQHFWFTSKGLVAAAGIGFLVYFLVVEHGEHLFPYLPYMILLLCPFMHFFMHGLHGKNENHTHREDSSDDRYRRGHEAGLRDREPGKGDHHA